MKKISFVVIDLLAVLMLAACSVTPDVKTAAEIIPAGDDAAACIPIPIEIAPKLEDMFAVADEAIPIPVVISQRLEDLQGSSASRNP